MVRFHPVLLMGPGLRMHLRGRTPTCTERKHRIPHPREPAIPFHQHSLSAARTRRPGRGGNRNHDHTGGLGRQCPSAQFEPGDGLDPARCLLGSLAHEWSRPREPLPEPVLVVIRGRLPLGLCQRRSANGAIRLGGSTIDCHQCHRAARILHPSY